MSLENIKLVVLDCAVDNWENPEVRELFNKIIQLKLNGYWAEHPRDVIVTDGSDFIGTHLLACKEEKGVLTPIMGYKSVTLERCEYFHQAFPIWAALRNMNLELDQARMRKILDQCKSSNISISYDSAWTANEEVRKNRELGKEIRELTTTLGVFYHQEYQIDQWITGGVLKFKTDQYFKWMGLQDITQPIPFPSLGGELVTLMHLTQYSKESLEIAEKHRDLWNQRIFIGADKRTVRRAA